MVPVINGRNLYKNIFNTKLFRKWIPDDPTHAAAGLALASTITKDAVNCYYYTTQSYRNTEIPEDKRKFVAANDLSNGFYNVIIPLVASKQITKAGDKTFDKHFAKHFDKKSAKHLYNKLSSLGVKCESADVEKVLTGTSKKAAKAGLAVVFTLVISQILCKRVITPLLATPSADHVKKLMQKYEDNKLKKLSMKGEIAEDDSENKKAEQTEQAKSSFKVDSKIFDAIAKPINYQA